MVLYKKILLLILIICSFLNLSSCNSINSSEPLETVASPVLSSSSNSYLESHQNDYCYECVEDAISKSGIEINEYKTIEIDDIGVVIWEYRKTPNIYFISSSGILYTIYSINGLFQSVDNFLDYKIYGENQNIVLHCQVQGVDYYYVVDDNRQHNIAITLDFSTFQSVEVVCKKEHMSCMQNAFNNKIPLTEINSYEDLSYLNNSSDISIFPEAIRDKPYFSSAIIEISDIAQNNSGPYYQSDAMYSFLDINNDERCELLLIKAINCSPTLLECHAFIIYDNGTYLDLGTNRAMMTGLDGMKNVSVCYDIEGKSLLRLHAQSSYKAEINDSLSIYNENGEEVYIYSEQTDNNYCRISVKICDDILYYNSADIQDMFNDLLL